MSMPFRATVGVLTACLCLSGTATDAQPSPSGTNNANYVWQWPLGLPGDRNAPSFDSFLCPPTANAITGTCGFGGMTVDDRSSATAGGVLRAEATLTLTNFVPHFVNPVSPAAWSWGVTATAGAVLYDQITFGGVIPAFVRFNYLIDGSGTTTSVDGRANLTPSIRMYLGAIQSDVPVRPGGQQIFIAETFGNQSRSEPTDASGSTDVAIAGNMPLDFDITLTAIATINSAMPDPINGTVTSDWSNTARWGVQAFDANGNDITAAADLEFASGATFPTVVTPEPMSATLVGTGLLILMVAGKRRQRRTDGRRLRTEWRGLARRG